MTIEIKRTHIGDFLYITGNVNKSWEHPWSPGEEVEVIQVDTSDDTALVFAINDPAKYSRWVSIVDLESVPEVTEDDLAYVRASITGRPPVQLTRREVDRLKKHINTKAPYSAAAKKTIAALKADVEAILNDHLNRRP